MTTMMESQWRRVADLGRRIRAFHEREEERRREKRERYWREHEAKQTEADRRFGAWCERKPHGPKTIGAAFAAKLLRIPLEALLRETRGLEGRVDFGRSWNGELLTVFVHKELVRFAKARLRHRAAPVRRAA